VEKELNKEREDIVFLKRRINTDKKKNKEVEKKIKQTTKDMVAWWNNDR
jgi:predicted phage-related endonuclease